MFRRVFWSAPGKKIFDEYFDILASGGDIFGKMNVIIC